MRAPSFALILLAAAGIAPRAAAEESEICVDDFSVGGNASFQGGFASGEGAAVRFSVTDGDPVTVTGLRFLYGGAEELVTFPITITVYDDNGVDAFDDPGYPGTALASETLQVVSSTEQVNELRFTTPATIAAGDYWLGVTLLNEGLPSIARDSDLTANRNALFSQGAWANSGDFGLEGDWILHPLITTTHAPTRTCNIGGEGEGEGEGDVGEGEGDVGEGEGDVGEGEGEGEGDVGEGEGEAGALVVTAVNPASTSEGEAVRVALLGGGFRAGTTFRIGPTVLTDVDVSNAGAALATFDGKLSAGVYDVIAQDGDVVFTFPSGFAVNAVVDGAVDGGCSSVDAAFAERAGLAVLLLFLRRRRYFARG